jgi:hypothetical protein
MVEDRIADGRRIAELLSSELEGRDGRLAAYSVTNAQRDVAPSADGSRAYDVERDGERVARVFVQPERVRIEVGTAPEATLSAAEDARLRVRPKSTDPPQTIVFVEDGAAVKRATDVFESLPGPE